MGEDFSEMVRAKKNDFVRLAQKMQDELFRQMTADEKLELGSKLWQLARDLVGKKILYEADRSKDPS